MPKSGCKHRGGACNKLYPRDTSNNRPELAKHRRTRCFCRPMFSCTQMISRKGSPCSMKLWDRSCRILQPQKFWEISNARSGNPGFRTPSVLKLLSESFWAMPKSGCKRRAGACNKLYPRDPSNNRPELAKHRRTRCFAGQCLAAHRWFLEKEVHAVWNCETEAAEYFNLRNFESAAARVPKGQRIDANRTSAANCLGVVDPPNWSLIKGSSAGGGILGEWVHVEVFKNWYREDAENCFSSYPTRSSCFFPTVFFFCWRGPPAISK